MKKRYFDVASAVGRSSLALILLVSAYGKLAAAEKTKTLIAAAGIPAPELAYLIAIAVEILGGLALVIGLRVRAFSPVLAAYCIVTAIAFHARFGDANQVMHFLKNVAMAGGFLQVFAFGAGQFSADAWVKTRRTIKPMDS